jgi:ubiquinone/menaquinone biosynthesis C-methylase UbiE
MLQHDHRNMPHLFAGRGSRVYGFTARHLLRRAYRRIARDLAPQVPTGGHVLDVGTGPAVLLAELARLRPDLRLTGVDLSADMVGQARDTLRDLGDRASAVTADAADLPFGDDTFDVIVSSYSLHHWDRPEDAAPELARVLRPGGRLVIYDAAFAPFDELVGAAGPALLASAPQRTPWRTGLPMLGRGVRQVMVAGSR